MNEKNIFWLQKLMGKFVILSFFQSIYEVFFGLFFILHGNLLFSLTKNIYLDQLYRYTKFQVAIMDFEFSTGENVVFPIEIYSYGSHCSTSYNL